MRDIEFRGKRIDSGEWCRGGLSGTGSAFWIYAAGNAILVSPETVGQYTGLIDKNGKKIFEGDIASFGGDKYRIIFDDACFWINSVLDAGYSMELHTLLGQGDIEVIGNIHDSPALFGGAK